MADQVKKKRTIKAAPKTIREKATETSNNPAKKRRLQRTASVASKPFKAAHRVGKKEYYLPMPDNRFGKFLNKRRYFIPRFFKEAWAELRQVTWPDRRNTAKLTLAVFTFAVVFGVLVALTDYGLDQLFKKTILK